MTDKKIERDLKEGRSQGEGAEYIPWIKVGEISSQGRGHRIKDPKNGREHHFFSDLEADYFWHLIWNDKIVDIREQYPLLPVEEAEAVAQELGYEYPREPGEDTRHVMTTDFLITVDSPEGNHTTARHVKYEKDLAYPRNLEKFEIERLFWENRGIELKAVTERSFDRRVAKNIAFLMGYYPSLNQEIDHALRAKYLWLQKKIDMAIDQHQHVKQFYDKRNEEAYECETNEYNARFSIFSAPSALQSSCEVEDVND